MSPGAIWEEAISRRTYPDWWSKDLVGTSRLPTTSGFSLGVAEYHTPKFGAPQTHDDQEAVYIVQGIGEALAGEEVYAVRPGVALYVPPGTKHALRRAAQKPVKVVYSHGPA